MLQNRFNKFLARLAVASVAVVSICASVEQPIYASDYTFYCNRTTYTGKSVPATTARTDDGRRVMIVRSVSQYFSNKLTNTDRCKIVSRRFQKFYDHGKLVYVNGGYIKGLPVICAVANREHSCSKNNVLYTLKPGVHRQITARSLMNRRGLAAGIILNESSSDSLTIDFNTFLENASHSRSVE